MFLLSEIWLGKHNIDNSYIFFNFKTTPFKKTIIYTYMDMYDLHLEIKLGFFLLTIIGVFINSLIYLSGGKRW